MGVQALAQVEERGDISDLAAVSPMTVFCDFDGPIMDVSERYYQTYCAAIAHVVNTQQATGVRRLPKALFWDLKQNRAPDLEIAMRSGLARSHMDGFVQHIRKIVNQPSLLAYDTLQSGASWALQQLRAQGVRLILVTLRQKDQVRQILEQEGLCSLFSDVWGSDDEMAAYHNQASHKETLLTQALEAVRRTSALPVQAWMIGDTEADILAGQAAGIPTVAVTCGVRSQRYLESYQPSCIHPNLLTATQEILKWRSLKAA